MYAYIYLRDDKKYLIVHEDSITDFHYQKIGHQNRFFASKPFLYNDPHARKEFVCQILVISASEVGIKEIIKQKTIHVPKLNDSDVATIFSQASTSEKSKVNAGRKALAKNKKDANVLTSQQILAAHLKKKVNASKNPKNNEDEIEDTHDSDTDDDNEDDEQRTQEQQSSDPFEEPNDEPSDEPSDTEKLRKENELLKQSLAKEKITNKKCYKTIELLTGKNNCSKKHAENDEKSSTTPNKVDEEKQENHSQPIQASKPKIPSPICTKSGVVAAVDAVHEAYEKFDPSKFYAHMCFGVWGYEKLSKRCVKKTKRKDQDPDQILLTPKKKRAVLAHFKHYLDFYEYPDMLYKMHISKVPTYAHRAIVSARKHMDLVREHPELPIEPVENPDLMEL